MEHSHLNKTGIEVRDLFFVFWGVLFATWAPLQDGANHQLQLEWSLYLKDTTTGTIFGIILVTQSWNLRINRINLPLVVESFALVLVVHCPYDRCRQVVDEDSSQIVLQQQLLHLHCVGFPNLHSATIVLFQWQRMLSNTVWSVGKPKSIFLGSNILNDCRTWWINPSISFVLGLFHWRDCRARKKDKSSTFVSGDFAGCVLIRIFQLPALAWRPNSMSSAKMCAGAPSCCIRMSRSLCGHFSFITGSTFSIINSQYLSRLHIIGLVTISPCSWLSLCRCAAQCSTIGHIPILPSNKHSPLSLYQGLAIARRSITFVMWPLSWINRFWASSSIAM